jgi:hypothetical protein
MPPALLDEPGFAAAIDRCAMRIGLGPQCLDSDVGSQVVAQMGRNWPFSHRSRRLAAPDRATASRWRAQILPLIIAKARPAKHGNKGILRAGCPEIEVSDVVAVMRIAAMNATKAMSCKAVSRRSLMPAVKSKMPASVKSGRLNVAGATGLPAASGHRRSHRLGGPYAERLKQMKAHLECLKAQGVEAID